MKKNIETLAFLRRFFEIPKKIKLSWGLVEETRNGETVTRVAVLLSKSKVYLDIEDRRFHRIDRAPYGVDRKIYAAKRSPYNFENYHFSAVKEDGRLFGRLVSRRFIFKTFYGTKYNPELETMPPL